jgi:flagellar biosynthesis GTPase FlhF
VTVKASGIVEARRRLSDLVNGLREATSGAVVARAARKVQEQITAVTNRILGEHVYSGTARSSSLALASGSVVQLSSIGYLKYHPWWPFRRGMPPFVVTRATKIFKAELEAALAGKPSPLALADAAAEDAAEAKRVKAAAKEQKRVEREARAVERERAQTLAARARAERAGRAQARRELRQERASERQRKRDARAEAKLNRSRERYKRANARIARSQARDAKRWAKR